MDKYKYELIKREKRYLGRSSHLFCEIYNPRLKKWEFDDLNLLYDILLGEDLNTWSETISEDEANDLIKSNILGTVKGH